MAGNLEVHVVTPEREVWAGDASMVIARAIVARARKIQRFLSQPFFVAAQFTGAVGKYVPLKDTIAGFQEILSGALDSLPEQAFYMVGNIEEAKARAEQLKKVA